MRTTGKATDLITFSRSSGGTALRKIAYGPELVTNGTFDSGSTGWITSGWTISSEQATVTGNGTNQNLYGTPVSNAVAGKVYQLSYQVITSSVVAGSFLPLIVIITYPRELSVPALSPALHFEFL